MQIQGMSLKRHDPRTSAASLPKQLRIPAVRVHPCAWLGCSAGFRSAAPLLSCREIAERTGISRPTVVRLVRTLVIEGYLKPAEATARYRLAPAVLSFAYPLLVQLNVRQIARKDMQQLADFAKGAVSLTMRSGINMVIVESCMDNNALTGRPDLGAIRPIATTALGGAYYSCAGASEQARDPSADPRVGSFPMAGKRRATIRLQGTVFRHRLLHHGRQHQWHPGGGGAIEVEHRWRTPGDELCSGTVQSRGERARRDHRPASSDLVRSVEIAIGTGSTHNIVSPRPAARAPAARKTAAGSR